MNAHVSCGASCLTASRIEGMVGAVEKRIRESWAPALDCYGCDTVKHERRAPFHHVLQAGIASIITTCVALLVLDLDRVPYLLASLGGSCVILFAIPDNVMAQPRSFIGGHLLGTTVGLMFSHAFGGGIFSMACAVGTAIALMMFTNTIHSPAGSDPLIVMAAHPGWSFLAAPLGLGLAILFVAAIIYHRLILHRVYPIQWF